ncbi:PH domain-containing protein [Paenibacillus tengchongensis]|uniref:PH domain-containing protein n=1 Tax=Paenibacillus tengchongensis TaxID=2608684 RepID=UPI001652A210|nr:PH domain-containing protein [Paenibacillus tengchongensis]
MVIRIRRSPIFVVILAAALAVVALSAMSLEMKVLLPLGTGFALLFSLIALYLLRCYFILEENAFVYVIGFQKKRIPYDTITHIGLSDDLSAAPAWTTTRIEILSANGRYLLSLPARKDTPLFIDRIRSHCRLARIDLDKLPSL